MEQDTSSSRGSISSKNSSLGSEKVQFNQLT